MKNYLDKLSPIGAFHLGKIYPCGINPVPPTIPEGYEFKNFQVPSPGDLFLATDGKTVMKADFRSFDMSNSSSDTSIYEFWNCRKFWNCRILLTKKQEPLPTSDIPPFCLTVESVYSVDLSSTGMINLPEGWEFVAFRLPKKDEFFLIPTYGKISQASMDWGVAPRIIVKKV